MTQLPTAFAASYHLITRLPQHLFHGEMLLLQIRIQNHGYVPWMINGPFPVRLGYRWFSQHGAVYDGGRAFLPVSIPPGMSSQIELRVEPPPHPGHYNLQIELLEEGQAWFSQRGVEPLRLDLHYAPVTAPRVAIINGNVVAHDAVGSHVIAQMQTLQRAGYYVLLITEFIDQRLPAELRRSMRIANGDELRDPQSGNPASAYLRQADIVIFNYSIYYPLIEMIRDIQRAVVIFDYHGVTPPELWGKEQPGYTDLVRGRDNLHLVRYADYGIGHSQYICDELIATGAIAPSRVSLFPYAVIEHSGYAGAPDPAVVERFGLADHYVLLYVGRMARNKRVIDLIEAMPMIRAQHPHTRLLLVGEDRHPAYREYADEMQQRIRDLELSEHVIFTGQVDAATLEACYRACTIFVTASIHEGFCMPVVEAMAHGRPVVAADATAIPGTLAGAGLLFTPADPHDLATKVLMLLDDLPNPGDHQNPMAVHHVAPATLAELAALRQKPIAIVTPRYGLEVLGGAETGMRSWAEQLVAHGYQVEVLTTGTLNMGNWGDQLPLGSHELHGVTLRRFATAQVESGQFHLMMLRAHQGQRLRYDEEQQFMAHNLRSHELETYIAEHGDSYACILYAPYLFGTTYWPIRALPERSIVVPCLHDEPSAHFAIFREMLESSAAIFFNAPAEGRLAAEGLGVANPYQTSLGFGFADDYPHGNAERFRQRTGISGPFLLYSGRIEVGKNVHLLVEWFTQYKASHPGPLSLVLTGTGTFETPERPDLVRLGMVSHAELLDAYAACHALCQLSCNESFSIVIMEAWLHGRPVIVSADSPVTREHVEQSGGGYAVGNAGEFAQALDQLLNDPSHADALGAQGYAYVQQEYRWSNLFPRIAAAIAAYSRPRPLYARLAQRGVARALAFTGPRFEDALLELVSRACADLPPTFQSIQQTHLHQIAAVTRPNYHVRSGLPVIGAAVAWLRRQITAHLKEPYLDPILAEQERFNRELLESLVPALDASLREQRRLRAEVELLRSQVTPPDQSGEHDPSLL